MVISESRRWLAGAVLAALLVMVAGGEAQEFDYIAPDVTVYYDGGAPSLLVGFSIHQTDAPPIETDGFTMGVAHDGGLLTAIAVDQSPALAIMNNGFGPSFFAPQIYPDGWILGVVYSSQGLVTLAFPEALPVAEVTYLATDLEGAEATSPLTWTDTLGTPPVVNAVASQGAPYFPSYVHGNVTLAPSSFVRGDCNSDGTLDLADVIFAELYMFLGGTVPPCLDACETTGNGLLDLADVISLLNYLFVGGPPPAAPHPSCGSSVPGGPTLGCAGFSACP